MMRQNRADGQRIDPFFQRDRQLMVERLVDAPALAMANFFQATSEAMSNAAHNATNAHQQACVSAGASLTQGLATLFATDTGSSGPAGSIGASSPG